MSFNKEDLLQSLKSAEVIRMTSAGVGADPPWVSGMFLQAQRPAALETL